MKKKEELDSIDTLKKMLDDIYIPCSCDNEYSCYNCNEYRIYSPCSGYCEGAIAKSQLNKVKNYLEKFTRLET